jgi:hypothetical protein
MSAQPLRVLVTGSRDWSQHVLLKQRLAELPRGSSIIHGGARGADQSAGQAARALGIPETAYPADWRGKGKAAGIIRNLAMLDTKPDLVLAFWDGQSTGTKHTIDEARRRGIPVEVIQ